MLCPSIAAFIRYSKTLGKHNKAHKKVVHETSLGNEMMTMTKMDVVGGKQFCINLVHWPEAPH